MKKTILLVSLLLNLTVSAQEPPQTLPASTPPPMVEPKERNFVVQGYLGLFGVYKTLPAGLSASYKLNPHFMLTAEHSTGSNSFIFSGGRNTEVYSLGLQYSPKPFQYAHGRLYYRLLINHTKVESEEFVFWSTEDWSYRADAFSTTLSLGYQQIYENGLTFSLDLIGVHVPLSEKFKNERSANATSAQLMRDNQKNIFDELNLTFLWLYIGYAF
jgi:hypothetical protein